MSVPVRDFLKARRDRALGSILGWAEKNLWSGMTDQQRRDFRAKVLEALDSYHDSVLDLVKSEDGIRNDEVVAALERLHASIERRPVQTPVHSPG